MSFESLLEILLIAFSLSADCFAVALGGSISQAKLRYAPVLRTALAFGIAQTLMPVIGWLIGRSVIEYISNYDHWVVFGLLAIVGGRMIWEAFHEKEESHASMDITRGFLLLSMAFATSIDSLAVGLSFALLPVNILTSSLIIGIVAFLITVLGFYVGRKAGDIVGQRAKILGGLILIAIGIRVVITHLIGA